MENIETKTKEFLNNSNGFIKNNNYNLVSIDENECKLEATITETSLNPFNIAHGGFIFGLADTAAGILANINGMAFTTSSTINYLNTGKGNKLIAIATRLKTGKNISNYEVEIYDEFNTLTAKAIIEYFYINQMQ